MSLDRYDIEAAFYDSVCDRTDDIQFYLDYCSATGGPVLELCCGTGRVTLALGKAGFDITGVDSNEKMLGVCRVKFRKESQDVRGRVELVVGDMRNFSLNKRFKLAMIPFSPFLHNETVMDEENTLRSIRSHLEDRGLLLIEVFNPDTTRPQQLLRLDKVKELPGKKGGKMMRLSAQELDLKRQLTYCTIVYDMMSPNGAIKRKIVQFTLRYVFSREFTRLLRRTGYAVEHVFGSVKTEPFTEKSGSIVVVARKIAS